MEKMTIRDVAQQAGVSTATVSDILRDSSRFSYRPETLARVQEAVQRLDYRPHAAAHLLRQRKTNLVGTAIDVHALHMSPLVRACHEALQEQGFQPSLLNARELEAGSSPLARPELFAGLLSIDVQMEQGVPQFYEKLCRSLPVIALYPVRSEQIESVTGDRAHAIELAVDHLVALGHRRIAFAQWGNEQSTPTSRLKFVGWKRALKKHRIAADAVLVPWHREFSLTEASQKIAEYLFHLQPRPTAVICGGESLTRAVLGALYANGCHVPREMSIISYGDSQANEVTCPPLTSITWSPEAVAAKAVSRLKELLLAHEEERPLPPRQEYFPAQLVERQSTAAPIARCV